MMRNTFIFVSLLSYSFLMYFPLDKNEFGLNNDDLCYYKEGNNKIYVKACREGYFCSLDKAQENGICLEYKPNIKRYKEKCNQDSDCYSGLKCDENVCVLEGNQTPYEHKDEVSGKKYYYCPNNTILNDQNNCISIINNDAMKDKCYLDSDKKGLSYDYLKVCGEYNEDQKLASISDFEKVDDGKIVGDVLACKSGFALLLNKDPQTGKYFQVCATAKYAEKDNNGKCIIRYNIGDKEFFYMESDANNDYKNNNFPECDFIMTKIELLKEYLNIYKKLYTHCTNGQFYNEPFTCENDELRKSWYYYNHPKDYLLYKDDEEIIDFLIQKYYPTHKSNETEQENNKDSSSGFLNNKYFLILFLLFI